MRKYYNQHLEGFRMDNCATPGLGSIVNVQGDGNRTIDPWVTKGPNYPDWRTRLRTGKQCTTSLSGFDAYYYSEDGYLTVNLNAEGCATPAARFSWMKGDLLKPPLFQNFDNPSSLIDKADNIAKAKVIAKLSSEFHSGTFLGELGETLRMIRNPTRSIREGVDKYVRSVRGLKGRTNPHGLQKAISDTWLATAYGWKPLIRDLEDGMNALDRLKNDKRQFRRIHCVGEASTFALNDYWEAQCQCFRIGYTPTNEQTCTVIYRGLLSIDAGSKITFARRLFGFTPEEFAPTAWNLIPYSFLVDYFTNIGDIINAWSYGRSNLRWTSKTRVEKFNRNFAHGLKHVPIGYTTGINILGHPHSYQKAKKITRNAYSGTFIPSFAWEVPGVGSTRWLNIAALAASRIL